MKQILGLLGIYFDAVVVEFKTFLLLFRLALAILCCCMSFLNLISFQTASDRSAELKQVFAIFDKNGDGYISK